MQAFTILTMAAEIIGTIAFSVSGALTAIDRGLDLFGVLFVSCVTAVGGGMMRDITIGRFPPAIFDNLPLLAIALAASLLVFFAAYLFRSNYRLFHGKIDIINNIFDAIGLAVFAVTGSQIVMNTVHGDNLVLVVFLGMLTGVGGGILRDMMTNQTPYVFKKQIYALAAIFGSILYVVLLKNGLSQSMSGFASAALIFIVRMLATKFHWELPVIRLSEK